MSLALYIKHQLVSSDRYLRLRYHPIVLAGWKKLRPHAAQSIQEQHHFYQGLLQSLKLPESMVFDIGANEGFTTQFFAAPGRQVIAVDPAPLNARILRARFRKQPAVQVIEKAVSDTVGTANLFTEKKGTALHTLHPAWKALLESGNYHLQADFTPPIPVSTTTLSDLITEFGCPALLKIDTEGYEQQVLSTLRQPVPQIVFEAILPAFFDNTVASIRHLQTIDASLVFNYAIGYTPALEHFVDADALIAALQPVRQSVDVICRMSNYKDYYQ